MKQAPNTLNFIIENNSFPEGKIKITEKLGTSCVKPIKEQKDLQTDNKHLESIQDQLKKYNVVIPESLMYGNGKDRREDVDKLDDSKRHTEFPYSAICALNIFFDNNILAGTGFMIGSRYILTAAHNLYQSQYGYAKNVYVSPGRRKDSNPFGVHKGTDAFLFTTSYKGSYYDDMAVIALDYEIGDYTGWFGMIDLDYEDLKQAIPSQPDGFSLGERLMHICGYDPPKLNKNSCLMQSLKIHSGNLIDKSKLGKSFVRDDILCYDIDTLYIEGQSGSPVWVLSGQNCYAVGVHNSSAVGQKAKIGARLTKEKITKICDLIGKQSIQFSNPFSEKVPRDLEEVLESFKNCNNNEEKNRLIEFLSSYKHYQLMDPLQIQKKIPEKTIETIEYNSLLEKIKDFEITCKIFKKEKDELIDFNLKKENFMKEIEVIQALKGQEKIDSLSLDLKNFIDHKQFKTILKMLPKIPKLYHLDMKINISNSLDLAELLSRVPNSEYFDLYIRQHFNDESIQNCSDILTCILDKNPKINLYLEFEFDQFNVKQIDHTMLKISNTENSKINIYPLKKGFCILVNDPRHKITESNIQTMYSRKSIFRCLKSNIKSSFYEDKKFIGLLREIMDGKKFIQFGEIVKENEGPLSYDHSCFANLGFYILLDPNGSNDLIEISLALNEKESNSIAQKNAKIIINKVQSIDFTFEGTESDDNTVYNLCNLIFDCQNLKHLKLNFNRCIKITDEGLKALSSIFKNLNSDLLTFSLDFGECKSISDAGIKELSRSIKHLSNISNFVLNFNDCSSISDAAMKELSQSIQFLPKISNLAVNFHGCSKVSDTGVKDLSQSIKNKINLSNLTLNFCAKGSSISDAGVKDFSQSIQNLSGISNLTLNFGGYGSSISDTGVKELSQSIKLLSNISNLNLNFSWCKSISDSGMKDLSQSIKLLSSISNLTLNFSYCYSISDAGMKEVSQSTQHLPSIISFRLNGIRKL